MHVSREAKSRLKFADQDAALLRREAEIKAERLLLEHKRTLRQPKAVSKLFLSMTPLRLITAVMFQNLMNILSGNLASLIQKIMYMIKTFV